MSFLCKLGIHKWIKQLVPIYVNHTRDGEIAGENYKCKRCKLKGTDFGFGVRGNK